MKFFDYTSFGLAERLGVTERGY